MILISDQTVSAKINVQIMAKHAIVRLADTNTIQIEIIPVVSKLLLEGESIAYIRLSVEFFYS